MGISGICRTNRFLCRSGYHRQWKFKCPRRCLHKQHRFNIFKKRQLCYADFQVRCLVEGGIRTKQIRLLPFGLYNTCGRKAGTSCYTGPQCSECSFRAGNIIQPDCNCQSRGYRDGSQYGQRLEQDFISRNQIRLCKQSIFVRYKQQ